MKVFSIYKATNKVNGKIYIGFDSNWPNRQWKHHTNYKTPKHPQYNCLFYKAIRKYGLKNFEWEVICQSKNGQYLLNEMEPYFIKQYDTFGKHGYNMTSGGEGALGCKRSLETKEKMSLWQKGIPKSEEHKIQLKIARNKRPLHSEETKKKISLSHKGRNYLHKKLPKSEETKKKMSSSAKIGWMKRKGKLININHY